MMNKISKLPKYLLLLFMPAAFILINSCKKSKVEEPGKKVILTIQFNNHYIDPLLGSVIFISDLQGKVIADTTFAGDGKLSIEVGGNFEIPGKFMVTLAIPRMGLHKLNVNMDTYLYTGTADWSLTGTHTDTLGHATITLTDLPQLTGPVLYSSSGFFNLTSNLTSRPVLLYKSPDDLYIKLPTASGIKYRWFTGLSLNGDFQIEAGTAESAGHTNISLPDLAINYEARVLGYRENGFDSAIPYTIDLVLSDGTPASVISVSHPDQLFSGYHTDIRYNESWESPATWCYRVDGDIPQEFRKISATVNSINASAGRVAIQKTGQYEVSMAAWEFSAQNKPEFIWQMFGPDTTSVFVLPALSPKFIQRFPELQIDSLVFQSVTLSHFIQPTTYDDYLEQILVSGKPGQEQHLESSSVIWLPLQSKN